MESGQIETIVQRLVVNPHDEDALATAHQAGAADPKSYALLLERVGTETRDPAYASHWLSEAANVWSTTLGDAHRAARVLMQAIERDPTQSTAAERLAQLYRDKGDVKALVALLERRAKALAAHVQQSPEIRVELAAMHEELGRLWNESLQQPKKALENFRRSVELDPANAYAAYGAREIYKTLGQWDDVVQMYDVEITAERDPERRATLLRDELATLRAAGQLAGVSRAIARAREADADDPALQQEYAATIVERITAGENVPHKERLLGANLLVGLAEAYEGEHGFAYSAGALDIEPGHDRALQLYAHYARTLEREDDVATRYLAYLEQNPVGSMAGEVRWLLSSSYEAAGQPENAIQILDALRAVGDVDATAKVRELYDRLGQEMPPAPPPPSAPSRGPGSSGGIRRAPVSTDRLQGLLDAAQSFAAGGKSGDAYQKYREVLEGDPKHPEALSWVQDYLRTKRQYAPLRDVLLAALRVPGESVEARKDRLREVAGLCEGNLRDVDGAINAWKQLIAIDRTDEAARQALTRLLEKSHRWDDLANLVEQDASGETDIEKKIVLEKKVAVLHETKRRDLSAAADALARIANLTPDDDRAILAASKMYEKAAVLDRAAQVISDNVSSVSDLPARAVLLERLGALRDQLADPSAAGDAYAEAAEIQKTDKLWDIAEKAFIKSERWDTAGKVAGERADLASEPKKKAEHLARGADHLARAADDAGALANLERAMDLDPSNEGYADQLVEQHRAAERWDELVQVLTKRAGQATDKAARVAARKQAAAVYAEKLLDKDAARTAWQKVLDDSEDTETIERLVADAVEREDFTAATGATGLLRRLEAATPDKGEKVRIALREAEMTAEGLEDVDAAIARYQRVFSELDASCRPALQAIADLQEARDNHGAAAEALEKELKLVSNPTEQVQIAGRLATLYEQLDDPKSAARALEVVCKADPEDFDSLARLCDLCERNEQWGRVAELLAARIEVEADEGEMATLSKKLSGVLAEKLDRGDEALAVLTELADQGHADLRTAYVTLGDKLGWRGIVATKLVEWWFEGKPGAERTANLRGAFDRFTEVGRNEDAVRIGCEIVRSKGADAVLAKELERLAIKTKDLDAIAVAHDLIARELAGAERAAELVRQAETRVEAGAPRAEAVQHGEAGLASVPPSEAEPLLSRLAALAEQPGDVVDLYERQVSRCKAPADRIAALARAAQVAGGRELIDRARGFFDIALGGTPSEEAMALLEKAARDADAVADSERMRTTLCEAFAGAGQGARDGGRTRGALLRRAASIAHGDLEDTERAFGLLGEALVTHVEGPTLDALESLAREVGDLRRAESTLARALGEVFDGPLVRQLLARRAKLRREDLDDRPGAAADLKKLHDLSPSDQAVADELAGLLTALGDFRGLVQLYEDQILRGKDVAVRAELARKVARMWEEQLVDPREAADAWRRVLRLRPNDPDATAGLDRAKSNMLKKPSLPSETELPPSPPSEPAVNASPAISALSARETQETLETPAVSPDVGLPAEAAGEVPDEPAADAAPPEELAGADEPPAPPEDVEAPVAAGAAPVTPAPEPEQAATRPPPPQDAAMMALQLPTVPPDQASGEDVVFDDEVMTADDLILDVEDAAEPEPEKPVVPVKRSIPPPLPRS
jgi:tetratricopeptide (TPR) repeat protein